MSIRTRPGAESFSLGGGPQAVLLVHGFTGSPASTRPLGEFLAQRGYTVRGLRLAGHGGSTRDLAAARWPLWEREVSESIDQLAAGCDFVSLIGISFGGALALNAAVTRPDDVAGVVLINPYVKDPRIAVAPIARFLVPSVKGIGNDIKKPGQDELCNERIPFGTLASVSSFLHRVRRELPSVRAPLLVFSSVQDHTVKPANSQLVMERAGSSRKELVRLTNSYHVATLDYDAELIFEETVGFLSSLAPAGGATATSSV